MKNTFIALIALLSLSNHAQANQNLDQQFTGIYGNFIVHYEPSSGKLKLADSEARKIYYANVRTGQEAPLNIEFLQFSRSPVIQNYVDYLLSATVAAHANSNGGIDFVIKAKVNFDGGTKPQAVLVFSANSRVAKNTLTGWNGNVLELKSIESDLHFDQIESIEGTPLPGSAEVYKLVSSLISLLWPSQGFHSTITQYAW